MILSQMLNSASFGACAMLCESPQPIGIDIALVASGLDLAGDRRPVHADGQIPFPISTSRPTPRPRMGSRAFGSAAPNWANPDERA